MTSLKTSQPLCQHARLLVFAPLALVMACASAVNQPDVKVMQQDQIIKSTSWMAPLPHAGSAHQLSDWWRRTDVVLGELIEEAQRESPTLASAVTRIERAREAQVRSASALLPDASLSASSVRGRQAPKTVPVRSARLGMQASWEVDLFGKNRSQHEAAMRRSQEAELGWHEASVSVAAETAAVYYALCYCYKLVEVLRQDAVSRAETARLIELTSRAGLAAPAHSELARASNADAQNQLLSTQAQCDVQVKTLVALTALDEQALREKLKPKLASVSTQPNLAEIFSIAEVPAQLLEQRPDIAGAQLLVAAAAADMKATDAQRYPMLSLSGSVGMASLRSGDATVDGSTWSLGPLELTLPMTNQRVTAASIHAATAAYDEASLQLRANVRNAVREVEEALVNLEAARERNMQAQLAAMGYRAALEAAQSRYRAGLASLPELEDARRIALLAQQSQLNVERDHANALIALYRAAGGGWSANATLPDFQKKPQIH